ncbi:BBE domain-containing protein [Paraglaciecola polaris]|uniref:BBE domain-containing protein n=1 Tax=Paraglaciecola polaris TaxID=222814 RepID=UPI003AB941B5
MTAIQYYLIFIMSGHIKTMSILGKAELKMYFGENSIRLLALKKRYDPQSRFHGSLSRHLLVT